MCRWLCYTGSPVFADALLFKPQYSLVEQSQHAQRSIYTVNGDGFGLGWYGSRPWPGTYHDTQPAWNDDNFQNLAAQIRSHMILAHVRATSGTAIQRTNCHPFRYQHWLFQHNGEIGGFDRLKRDLQLAIAPELFPQLRGTTDSETMLYLAITFGLAQDPLRALERMVGLIEKTRRAHRVKDGLYMTVAAVDGKRVFAVRYASDHDSPSLYHSKSLHALRELGGKTEDLPDDGILILSEPLDAVSQHWEKIPDATALVVENGNVTQLPFKPEE